jgi:hypothetical protein
VKDLVARAEHLIKKPVWGCEMCGQCALHSTGLTCPMTCPKTLRNGPCGEGPHRLELSQDLGVTAAVDHRQLGGHYELARRELALKVCHPRPPPSRRELVGRVR